MNLSADIFSDQTGRSWTARIHAHPEDGGDGILVWERSGMRTERNAETAMEAAWIRIEHGRAVNSG